MNKKKAILKTSGLLLRPTLQDGYCIKCFLKLKGFSLAAIGHRVCIKGETVLNVVCGRRRSSRVEAEIARVLGKASWNEVVAEARLAVSGNYTPSAKDVSKFLTQTYRQHQKQITAAQKRAEEGVKHCQSAAAKKAPREAV